MGIIFDIKRFAVHDGPGIRVTVFLKGCPLRCAWCHNPESISTAICEVPKSVRIGNKTFTEMETVGREISVEELMKELEKEKIFMDESGGGVTFSGGEPLLQHKFLNEALQACFKAGIHTAVDTSGFAKWEVLEKVAKFTDLFLYDLKLIDDELHKKYTGVSNKLIIENLTHLLKLGKKIWIRLPMIPGITFTETNVSQTIDILKQQKYQIECINLLPYHNTASHKYDRFGFENLLPELESVTKSDLEKTKKQFEEAGFFTKIGG